MTKAQIIDVFELLIDSYERLFMMLINGEIDKKSLLSMLPRIERDLTEIQNVIRELKTADKPRFFHKGINTNGD